MLTSSSSYLQPVGIWQLITLLVGNNCLFRKGHFLTENLDLYDPLAVTFVFLHIHFLQAYAETCIIRT